MVWACLLNLYMVAKVLLDKPLLNVEMRPCNEFTVGSLHALTTALQFDFVLFFTSTRQLCFQKLQNVASWYRTSSLSCLVGWYQS